MHLHNTVGLEHKQVYFCFISPEPWLEKFKKYLSKSLKIATFLTILYIQIAVCTVMAGKTGDWEILSFVGETYKTEPVK